MTISFGTAAPSHQEHRLLSVAGRFVLVVFVMSLASCAPRQAPVPTWYLTPPADDSLIRATGTATAATGEVALLEATRAAELALAAKVRPIVEARGRETAAPLVARASYLQAWIKDAVSEEVDRMTALALEAAGVEQEQVSRDPAGGVSAYVLVALNAAIPRALANEDAFLQFRPGESDDQGVVRSSPSGDDYPAFVPHIPWPPPRESASATVPSEFLVGDEASPTLGDVAARLGAAFEECGYEQLGWYMAPGGFAFATSLEQVDDQGKSKEGSERWCVRTTAPRRFTLSGYLKALFTASRGMYRTILVVVSPYAFGRTDMRLSAEAAAAWYKSGMVGLPAALAGERYTDEHACTVLIYEFERPTSDDEPSLKEHSDIPGRQQLTNACVWESLEGVSVTHPR